MNERTAAHTGRLSAAERQLRIDLYKSGLKLDAIAAITGRHKSSISRSIPEEVRRPCIRAQQAYELRRARVGSWDEIARLVGYANGNVARVQAHRYYDRLFAESGLV